jgi:hypothetical protein
LFRFTFHLSNVKKNCVSRFVRAKREIFAKITLERKKFRLRSTFHCSNVTKKSLCFTFCPSETWRRNVKTLTPLPMHTGWVDVDFFSSLSTVDANYFQLFRLQLMDANYFQLFRLNLEQLNITRSICHVIIFPVTNQFCLFLSQIICWWIR